MTDFRYRLRLLCCEEDVSFGRTRYGLEEIGENTLRLLTERPYENNLLRGTLGTFRRTWGFIFIRDSYSFFVDSLQDFNGVRASYVWTLRGLVYVSGGRSLSHVWPLCSLRANYKSGLLGFFRFFKRSIQFQTPRKYIHVVLFVHANPLHSVSQILFFKRRTL